MFFLHLSNYSFPCNFQIFSLLSYHSQNFLATHFVLYSVIFFVFFPYFVIVFCYFLVIYWFDMKPKNNHYFDYYQFWLLNGFTCYQLWYMNHFLVIYWFDSGCIILLEKKFEHKKIKISYLSRLIHYFLFKQHILFSIAKITIQFMSLYLLLYQLI